MKAITTLGLLAVLATAAAQGPEGADDMSWLAGCWQTPDSGAIEVWSAEPDGSLLGFGIALGGGKVAFYELLTIARGEDGALVYTARPSGQATTSFTATSVGERRAVFENRAHDYPQKIAYRRDGNKLYATISLANGDKPQSFDKQACD